MMRSECLWRFLVKERSIWREKPPGFRGGEIWFLFHGIWFLSCVITCSDFYPLSNQINLFMVINIWGIIIWKHMVLEIKALVWNRRKNLAGYCSIFSCYVVYYLILNVISSNSDQGEVYNIMWSSLSVSCDRSVVFSGYSGFLHL